jgi:hypothetical protein
METHQQQGFSGDDSKQSRPGRLITYYGPHVLPFALFAACTYAGPLLDLPAGPAYIVKTLIVGASLVLLRRSFQGEIRVTFSLEAVLAGVAVFGAWILLDDLYPHIGQSFFNPYAGAAGGAAMVYIAFRMVGAVLVVPVMEEIFWRSFALRFVLRSDFRSVPLGRFSWYAFILVSLLFGLEHHRWLAGIIAGLVYAGLLFRSRNLFVPILSHAVTNLLLGLYVLWTREWTFW